MPPSLPAHPEFSTGLIGRNATVMGWGKIQYFSTGQYEVSRFVRVYSASGLRTMNAIDYFKWGGTFNCMRHLESANLLKASTDCT